MPVSILNRVNDFFESYAKAYEHFDTKLMAFLHNIPCTLLDDESTSIYQEASKLEGLFNQGIHFYKQHGIVHARAEVWNMHALTDKITKVKVNWKYYNAEKQPVYNCDYHYILKLDKHDQPKIVLSVSVNEKERMEAWLQQQTNK
ncbi:MAG: hypothetical protein JSS96_00130 [Bacteroidetes bacterium]|nr:hypothetical protein [Bacteroidota bacterium]